MREYPYHLISSGRSFVATRDADTPLAPPTYTVREVESGRIVGHLVKSVEGDYSYAWSAFSWSFKEMTAERTLEEAFRAVVAEATIE